MCELDDLRVLVRRAQRARREGLVLLLAVIATNVAYGVVSAVRGPSTLAWTGIIAASAIAHIVAWRSRQSVHHLNHEIYSRLSALRSKS